MPLVVAVGSLGCQSTTEAPGPAVAASKPASRSQQVPAATPGAEPSSGEAERPVKLDEHRWKHRPLVVFVPRPDEALERHRARWRGAESGVRDRDMWLAEVVGDRVYCEGEPCGTASALRERFRPEEPVTVVLIGKDGREKLRGPALGPEEVFRVIDQMPMRRREMGARGPR